MTRYMAQGYLRLKVAELLEQHGISLHRASQEGGFSYSTVHRYMRKPETVESMHMRSVVGLLVDALGMTPEEVENLCFGEVFEVVLDVEEDTG